MDVMDIVRARLPRIVLVDLMDRIPAKAMRAHEIVRDNADLDPKRAREATGQLRFRMQEKAFEEVCGGHGAIRLAGDFVPGANLRVFQPFMQFGAAGQGLILGLATIPSPRELPVKNQSRSAGVTLNYHLTPRLDLDGTGPQVGDIFVLFLVSRDPSHPGEVAEMAVGIIDSPYSAYIEYEAVEQFVQGYDVDRPDPAISPDSERSGGGKLVKLKPIRKTFRAPEDPDSDDRGVGGEEV